MQSCFEYRNRPVIIHKKKRNNVSAHYLPREISGDAGNGSTRFDLDGWPTLFNMRVKVRRAEEEEGEPMPLSGIARNTNYD